MDTGAWLDEPDDDIDTGSWPDADEESRLITD